MGPPIRLFVHLLGNNTNIFKVQYPMYIKNWFSVL